MAARARFRTTHRKLHHRSRPDAKEITRNSNSGHRRDGRYPLKLKTILPSAGHWQRQLYVDLQKAIAVRTPSRITASEFSDSLRQFLDACCALNGNTLCCVRCLTPILHVRAALSIHTRTCTGWEDLEQRIWTISIPYCPRCEAKPKSLGSLYLSAITLPKAS